MSPTATPDPTEFTVSAYDMEDQKERHRVTEREYNLQLETVKQKGQTRRTRWTVTMYVVVSLIAATVILGLVYLIWQGNKGPSAKQQIQERLQTACIEKGGTWTQLGSDSDKTCVFMREIKP